MDQRSWTVRRILRIGADGERGSYTIEGIVAVGVFFLLMALIVQLGFLILARSAAATSVEGALRKAANADISETTIRDTLKRDISAVVPGVTELAVSVQSEPATIRVRVEFRWVPPGPDLIPVGVTIDRSTARTVPP